MTTSWLSGIIGQGIASSIGAMGATGPTPYPNTPQQSYNVPGAQGMSQGSFQGGAWTPPKWMFNGKMMDFKEFVDTMFPEDTPEKTAFVLKYSE